MNIPITGQTRTFAVSDLKLDPWNPRLPEVLDVDPGDPDGLTIYVAVEYDSLRIARSISEFGYFPTEPPICVDDDGKVVVVEGNRRVAALKILLSDDLKKHSALPAKDTWRKLSRSNVIPAELPVLIVSSRHALAPLIAYRHISGIEAWEPWAQARFVANLVDHENVTFKRASSLVGESEAIVKRYYRDYRILKQAEDTFGVDTARAQARFGIFTRAMQDGGIRQYIGAPTPGQTEKGKKPLARTKKDDIGAVLGWLFGSKERQKVIDESRDITDLGKVLASEEDEAVRLLRDENDLAGAFAAAGGIKDRLLKHLADALGACARAQDDLPDYASDEEVRSAVDKLHESVTTLSRVIG